MPSYPILLSWILPGRLLPTVNRLPFKQQQLPSLPGHNASVLYLLPYRDKRQDKLPTSCHSTTTRNVGIANQFAGMRAEIQNSVNMQNLGSKKRLYDGNVLANSNFDKEKLMANEVVRKNLISGMTNAQRTHWLNSFYDQFDLDPTSGAILFEGGKQVSYGRTGTGGGGGSLNAGDAYLAAYMKAKGDYPGASEETWRKAAEINSGIGRRTQSDDDGDGMVDKSKISQQALNQLLSSINFGTP